MVCVDAAEDCDLPRQEPVEDVLGQPIRKHDFPEEPRRRLRRYRYCVANKHREARIAKRTRSDNDTMMGGFKPKSGLRIALKIKP